MNKLYKQFKGLEHDFQKAKGITDDFKRVSRELATVQQQRDYSETQLKTKNKQLQKLRLDYQALVKHNAVLNAELNKDNTKTKKLQEALSQLKDEYAELSAQYQGDQGQAFSGDAGGGGGNKSELREERGRGKELESLVYKLRKRLREQKTFIISWSEKQLQNLYQDDTRSIQMLRQFFSDPQYADTDGGGGRRRRSSAYSRQEMEQLEAQSQQADKAYQEAMRGHPQEASAYAGHQEQHATAGGFGTAGDDPRVQRREDERRAGPTAGGFGDQYSDDDLQDIFYPDGGAGATAGFGGGTAGSFGTRGGGGGGQHQRGSSGNINVRAFATPQAGSAVNVPTDNRGLDQVGSEAEHQMQQAVDGLIHGFADAVNNRKKEIGVQMDSLQHDIEASAQQLHDSVHARSSQLSGSYQGQAQSAF